MLVTTAANLAAKLASSGNMTLTDTIKQSTFSQSISSVMSEDANIRSSQILNGLDGTGSASP
jgi:Mrp family chromosome partitioning ATPase